MKNITINKKINLCITFSVLGLFFILSGIAFAEQKLSLSPFDSKEMYVSPDGKFKAVTVQKNEEVVETYIIDETGRTIVKPHRGSFVSWSSDSSKIILFLSDTQDAKGRELYILGTDSSYKNSDLPVGTISASFSSANSDMVYSLTEKGTDNSDVYIRNSKGEDRLILKDGQNILTWLRWSPHDNKILFMQSDLLIRPGKQFLWIMDPDGNNKEKIAPIDWDYPAVWSPDGTSIAFANDGNIWEYRIQDKVLTRLTNQETYQPATHPEYSSDGKTISYITRSRYTENILSVGSLQSNKTGDPDSESIISGDEIASSTLEREINSPEAATSSFSAEDQFTHL